MDEVLIDVTRLLGRLVFKRRLPTGIDRVDLEYVRYFAERGLAVVRFGGRSVEMSRRDSQYVFQLLTTPLPRLTGRLVWVLTKAFVLPATAARDRGQHFLLNTGHSGLDQPGYPGSLVRHGSRPLFFVHDLIPLTHPEYCRAGERERHARRMDTVLRFGHGIIANSRATLGELAAYAESTGQPLPPAIVALLAPPVLPEPAPRPPLAGPYFVMLGTIEPRKNHWLLLQVWRRLVERYGEQAPRLVIIGQRGWECQNVLALLDRCQTLTGVVVERPACSDLELASYLKYSRALLFPSFIEGYGLPLAEALSLGVPVIASDLAAFREIAADVPDYLDPLDGLGWMAKVEEFAQEDSAGRSAQLQRLAGFRVPDWEAHFAAVERLLEGLKRGEVRHGSLA